MNELDNNTISIKNLIKGLSNEEINSVRKYLNCFDETFGNTKTKTANLFDLLISDENLSQKEIINLLYTNPSSEDAFDKLSRRLSEKIHECLLLDVNVERKDVYPDYIKASIDVRKKIMQAHIMLGRGLSKDLNAVYDKIILKAKKFELYSELVEVLYLKQIYLGFRRGKTEFENLIEDIRISEKSRDAVNKALIYYYQLIVNNDFSAVNQVNREEFEQCINELQTLYKVTKSANVGYYLHLIEFEFYQLNGQYHEAKLISLKLVDLIQENPSIYMKRRLGSAFVRLSENELHTYDFKESALHARLAQDYFHKNTINHNIARETEFFSYYYQGNLEKAEKIINGLVEDSRNIHSDFRHAKQAFWAANVALLLNKRKETTDLLNQTKEIDKDKEGWNIGVRILSIMNQIESEGNDLAESHIENMRKHIERTMKMKEVRPRDITILRILNELVNQSFDFKAVWSSRKQLFEQLASFDGDQAWTINSHELILFHEWFKAKALQTEYPLAIRIPDTITGPNAFETGSYHKAVSE